MSVGLKIQHAFFLDSFIICDFPFSFIVNKKIKQSSLLLLKLDSFSYFQIMHIYFMEHSAGSDQEV